MRLRLLLIVFGAFLVVATFTFPYWQPLLEQEAPVQEIAFPGLALSLQDDFLSLPPEQQRAYLALQSTEPATALAMVQAVLGPRAAAPEEDEEMPEMNAPVTAATGSFGTIDAIRWGRGSVTIFQQVNAPLIMRFEGFSMPNAPDARVILSPVTEPETPEAMREGELHLEVGLLKGSVGNQNYTLPANTDLAVVRSVVIYSQQLDLIYTYAPLFVRAQ